MSAEPFHFHESAAAGTVSPTPEQARQPLLLTSAEAAKLLSISQGTLWNNSFPRGPIPVVRIPGSRLVRYSLAALKEFVEACQEGGRP
jgi:hypothetical protein